MPSLRVVQVLMTLLATLSTIMLGMGERSVSLPIMAVVVAAGSLYLTDFTGLVRLNAPLANLAALLAVGVAAWELNHLPPDDRVLAVANLMIYLQFILLFKRKTVANFWLLAVVSLLQVAVASALNLNLVFGLLLLLYLVLALTALTCFYLWREGQPNDQVAAVPRRGWWRAADNHWSGHELVDHRNRLRAAPLVGLVGFMSTTTLAIAALIFVVVPRIGQATWQPANFQITQIAFNNQVTLGQLGEVVQDTESVMQLKLFDAVTGDPLQLIEPPRMRGTSVSRYRNGTWDANRLEGDLGRSRIASVAEAGGLEGLVRQRVTINPLDNPTLFALHPPLIDQPNRSISYHRHLGRLSRTSRMATQRMTYELYVGGIRNGAQTAISPNLQPLDPRDDLLQMPEPVEGGDPLAELRRLAAQIVADLPADDHLSRALRMESYLRSSGDFRYSLLPVDRDRDLDPLEDFCSVNRVGHCEFFASALVMMLRSQGIPARMVLGYYGGEYNHMGQFYQFDQLHAHAWAEAYLAPDQLSDVPITPAAWDAAARRHGAWLRLDGTPGDVDLLLADQSAAWLAYKQLTDMMQFVWTNYVLGMDAAWQRETVYEPLWKQVTESLEKSFAPGAWGTSLDALVQRLTGRPVEQPATDGSPPSGAWWRLLTFAGLVVALLGVAVWALRWWWRSAARRRRQHRRPPPTVEFYRRFERLLARRALTRPGTQTPREFAAAAGGQLAEELAQHQAAALPRRVVDAYYRVRFGRHPLDNAEAAAVELALDQLRDVLQSRVPAAQAPTTPTGRNAHDAGPASET